MLRAPPARAEVGHLSVKTFPQTLARTRRSGQAGPRVSAGRCELEPRLRPLGQLAHCLLQGAPDLAEQVGRVRGGLAPLAAHCAPQRGRGHLDGLLEQRSVDLSRNGSSSFCPLAVMPMLGSSEQAKATRKRAVRPRWTEPGAS